MKIAVFYGGRSCEHDISVITGVQAMAALDRTKYDVYPIYMHEGAYYTGDDLFDISFYDNADMSRCRRLWLIDGAFCARIKNILVKKFRPDVALICCHGGEGENGCLQGVLESASIPYTSSGTAASGIAMDKSLCKTLCDGLMLNTVESLTLMRTDFRGKNADMLRHVETYLDYPVIVKPCSLGSSIGITRANNREELQGALDTAFAFDKRALVETALTNFTELNCAVFSDGERITVSEIEQPISWNEFLTFEDKYTDGGKGMSGQRRLPADIDEKTADAVKETTELLYKETDMSGVVRVDYLVSEAGKLYVNEINTVPGSLAFYLFEPLGISFDRLLDGLIRGASAKFNDTKKSRLAFNSSVLKNFSGAKGKQLPKCR